MEVNQTLLPPHPCYSHYELPRLHIPSSSQPQSSSPCHWKTAASQPVSRMRMMANFFRPPHKSSSPPASSIVPSTTGTRLLPSFHEMLSRTKNLVLQREIHSNTEPFDQHKTYNNHWRSQAPPPLDMDMITSDCTSVTSDGSEDPSFVSTPTTTLYTTQNGKCTSKRRERWTEEEHVRFLDGLHRYGRKWKKIQLVVPTKTAIQIRTHAYGFFAKLVRNMPENESNCSSTASKRRMEPLTDANGMDILRRFVFPKRFSIETKEEGDATTPTSSPTQNEEQSSPLVEWNRLEEQHE